MPATPRDHWEYTIREWTNNPFTKIMDNLPEEVNVFYDLGANVGAFSYLIKNKYPESDIYAFEPISSNFEALVTYMPEINHIQKGIFYGQSTSRVLSRGDGNIGAFFVEHIDTGPDIVFNGQIMELEELESFDIPKPDLIKMDIEGAEENVIEFSKIVKNCPNLIVEWHPNKNPYEFFAKHLPKHEIKVDLEGKQFLLCLK